MLRHVVLWTFREGEEAKAAEFLEKLRALYGVIPEILGMEIHTAVGGDSSAMLQADFADKAALETYKNDPRHKAVSALCKSIRTSRASIDYEL